MRCKPNELAIVVIGDRFTDEYRDADKYMADLPDDQLRTFFLLVAEAL